MIRVLEMQFIAFMLKNFLVVTPKLCSMLGVQHHAQNYAGINFFKPIVNSSPSKVYSYPDDQRKPSNITPGFKLIL